MTTRPCLRKRWRRRGLNRATSLGSNNQSSLQRLERITSEAQQCPRAILKDSASALIETNNTNPLPSLHTQFSSIDQKSDFFSRLQLQVPYQAKRSLLDCVLNDKRHDRILRAMRTVPHSHWRVERSRPSNWAGATPPPTQTGKSQSNNETAEGKRQRLGSAAWISN